MSVIEANVTIDLNDEEDANRYIQRIQRLISSMNGKETKLNVVEVDDPISMSPISRYKKGINE